MAYIDPEGMFGGDRMALLSDSAKMAWPWFWCASNTVGRIELNYRAFCDGPFRQFRKPPTEKQFWEWVAEFHEAYLMYVYQVSGKAWGQWDVSERYLPRYKTKADERTPAPVARPWLDWQQDYRNRKENALSDKCRVFNVSNKFQNLEKVLKNLPKEEEEEVEVEEELKPSCAAVAAPLLEFAPPVPINRHGTAWFNAQHERWYQGFWNHVNKKTSRAKFEVRVRDLVTKKLVATPEEAVEFLCNESALDQQRFRPTQDWEWRQNLHPATWLHQERWKDEARVRDPPAQFKSMQQSVHEQAIERIRKREAEQQL